MIRLSWQEAARLGVVKEVPTGQARRCRSRKATPEDVLWQEISATYQDAQREYQGAVPGRRFRIDIALVDRKIAIECDGWANHGKYRKAHRSDRERQNLLAVRGWLILRFTCGQIYREMNEIKAMVDAAVEQRRGDEQPSLS